MERDMERTHSHKNIEKGMEKIEHNASHYNAALSDLAGGKCHQGNTRNCSQVCGKSDVKCRRKM